MMVKPTADALCRIATLARTDRQRDTDLIHMTILPFVDLAEWPAEFVAVLCRAMEGFEADVFDVCCDRIVERRAVTLRSRKRQAGARLLQKRLMAHLQARDFGFFGEAPDPHVTVSYHRDGQGNETIVPISWTVDEILLVESVFGKATHMIHGRWKLRRRLL
jgi:2'-5' RNA ligase